MDKFSSLIKRLEEAIKEVKQEPDRRSVRTGFLEEILAAMRAQMPRLVTEADFISADSNGCIPVWEEVQEKDGSIVEIGYTVIRKGALRRVSYARFWTKRPSMKQRESTPWPD